MINMRMGQKTLKGKFHFSNENKCEFAGIVKRLKEKFGTIDYSKDNLINPDEYFINKYKDRIEKNWYGYGLFLVPKEWVNILEEFYSELEKVCPNYKILQNKTKMGSFRGYFDLHCNSEIITDIVNSEIHQLESWLGDPSLIY